MADWDYGGQADLQSIYAVTSFPELIYGVKSQNEISADSQTTGLPVTVDQSPIWTLDYAYRTETRVSDGATYASLPQAEFNVAIESFWHDSCDIQRSSNPNEENTVFELMVWLKTGIRKPSGQPPIAQFTSSDGLQFDIYTKYQNPKYIAYVAKRENTQGTLRYSEFIQHSINNASEYGIYQLQARDCMANILMGPEIWHGRRNLLLG